MNLHAGMTAPHKARVLAVDDSEDICRLYKLTLGKQYDIETVTSGQAALDTCTGKSYDLLLMDASMPAPDGFETSRRLREDTDVPIIFVTGHQGLDEHLRAYESGATDILTKPFRGEILLRKIELAIAHHHKTRQLADEKKSLQKLAMSFFSSLGASGTLLNFVRNSVGCRSQQALAENLVAAIGELGLSCCVRLRHAKGETFHGSTGEPTELERSILDQSAQMGKVFRFRQRVAINYDKVSIIVSNMPDDGGDTSRSGRLIDNLIVLAETVEGLCENVDMRLESMHRAEQMQVAMGCAVQAVTAMQRDYYALAYDTRLLLQNLYDRMEESFSWLGVNRQQEEEFLRAIQETLSPVLSTLEEGSHFEKHFEKILDAMKVGDDKTACELF